MSVNPSPFGPKPQFELATGEPAVGGQLFFYIAGSVNTKQNTYTDSTGGSTNTNPIVLNSLGQPANQIWFTAGVSYKVVYAPAGDTDPPSSPIWTIDNLLGINDIAVALDQWVSSGAVPTFVNTTTFTLAGDQTTAFHVGRRLKFSVTAGTVYGTIASSVFAAVTTVTVTMNAAQVLDSGLSQVQLALLTADVSSVPQIFTAGTGLSVAYASGKPAYSMVSGFDPWVLLDTQSPSGSAQVDFTSSFGLGYDLFMLDIAGLVAASDDVVLGLRIGTGGGPTYQATGYDWGGRIQSVGGGADKGSTTNADTTRIYCTAEAGATVGLGNAANEHLDGRIFFSNPNGANFPLFQVDTVYDRAADGTTSRYSGGGRYATAGAITAIRLFLSTGNIASGTLKLYGLRK